MKTELKEISPTQKEIHVEIDAETVKAAYGKVSQKYARAASVPGFRKGNAPLDVVRMRYKDEISSEVLQEVVPKAVTAAIEEHALQPLAEPHLHLDDQENVKTNGSQPLSLHVHVEIMPEIPTPEYKNLELTKRVKPVEDSQIEDLIKRRLSQQSAMIPVEDRPSADGDTVFVDLAGSFENEPGTPAIKADDLEITLGDEQIEKSFSENLLGVSEDDEKDFTVVYPADFTSPGLAGKTVNYTAKIKSVGKLETPELNDEWAQSLDEGYETVADLRRQAAEDLGKYADSDADARMRNSAIEMLIGKYDFEIPPTLIDSQAKNLLDNFAQDLQQRGADLTKVDKEFVQMAYTQMQAQAERDVRGALLLEKIADLENIEISDEDLSGELKKMAEYYRTTEDEVRKSMESQNGLESVRNNLRTRRAIEALVSNAKVTEGEWIDEEAQMAQQIADNAENAGDEAAETEAETGETAENPETAAVEAKEKKETKKKTAKAKK